MFESGSDGWIEQRIKRAGELVEELKRHRQLDSTSGRNTARRTRSTTASTTTATTTTTTTTPASTTTTTYYTKYVYGTARVYEF